MRIALLGLVLAGCMDQSTTYPPSGGGGGGYYPPPPPPSGGTPGDCTSDTQCPTGDVCARTFECLPSSDVYAIHVSWTLQGQPASTTSCATAPNLDIDFTGSNVTWWGYAPVPCVEGKFSIDKMPTGYTHVELVRDGDQYGGDAGNIDPTTGTVALDMPY